MRSLKALQAPHERKIAVEICSGRLEKTQECRFFALYKDPTPVIIDLHGPILRKTVSNYFLSRSSTTPNGAKSVDRLDLVMARYDLQCFSWYLTESLGVLTQLRVAYYLPTGD